MTAINAPDTYERQLAKVELAKREMKRHPWLLLKNYIYTLDPNDARNPVKKYPDKEYLKQTVEYIHDNQLVLVEKSRQMLLTWTVVAYFLGISLLYNGKYTFFVSRKEDDAGLTTPLSLLNRVKFMHDHLPKWLQQEISITKQPPVMVFNESKSTIHAVSQDSDALRSYTASGIFSDEMAYQEKAREVFRASKPTIGGGGKFIGVSTPHGKNFFYDLVKDEQKDDWVQY